MVIISSLLIRFLDFGFSDSQRSQMLERIHRVPEGQRKKYQRSPWRTSTPYVPTSTTLPTHKIRQPHCSNSLSNSLSVKRRPRVVIERRHRCLLLHQSRGVEKLRFDIGVMMHFHHGLQMNSWSCSATEMVCRRQLYTIERPSIY